MFTTARKAFVAGLTAAVAGLVSAYNAAISDGKFDGMTDVAAIAGFTVGAFVLGAWAVYRTPNKPAK